MFSTIGLIIGLLSLISRFVIAGNASHLGCFDVRSSKLTKSRTEKPIGSDPGFKWCLDHCKEQNYTFAGIQHFRTCRCGEVLGKAKLVPLHECIAPCKDGICGKAHREIVYILDIKDASTEIVHPTSPPDLSAVNFRQYLIVVCTSITAVVVLCLFLHCVRVSWRRDRLMKLYIGRLEQGERGIRRPPGTCTVSNTLCAEFFCCCCARHKDDGLDYDELLAQLDIHPDHRQSFSHNVQEYVKRCETEKNMKRDEVEQVLRSLARSGSLANTRSSLAQLADQIARSKRPKKHTLASSHINQTIPMYQSSSSPVQLSRRMNGSSVSSIEKAFVDSRASKHLGMFDHGTRGRSVSNDARTFGGVVEEGGSLIGYSASQCSSNRLLPTASRKINRSPHHSRDRSVGMVSTSPHHSRDRSVSRLSRQKHRVQSESPRRHRRSWTRNVDSYTATSVSRSGSETDD